MSIFSVVVILLPFQTSPTRKDHLQAKRALAKSESSPEAEPEPLPLEPELPSLGSRLHAAGTSQAAAGDGPGFSIPTGPACFGTGEI